MAPPLWARRLAASGHGLFSWTSSRPPLPPSRRRCCGWYSNGWSVISRCPRRVRVVAAANPPEEAADGWQLSAPLANRLVHLDWPVDAKSVANGIAMGFGAPPVFDGRLPSEAQTLAVRAAVGAFLEVRPALVLQVPQVAEQAGRGWPSPRSWDSVARLLAACDAIGATDSARMQLVIGAVGEGAGIEFLSWLANMDLPDPEAVLADPDGFELPERSDRAFAVLTAVATVAIAHGDAASWSAAWRVVARVAANAPDVATLAARALAGARPGRGGAAQRTAPDRPRPAGGRPAERGGAS